MKGYSAVVDSPVDERSEHPDSSSNTRVLEAESTRGRTKRVAQSTVVVNAEEASLEALVRRIYDQIINQGNMELADEILSADFVDHVPRLFPGQPVKGPAALTWVVSSFRTVFPDLYALIDDVVMAGDTICVRSVWTGTHQGGFLGIVPTGRRIKVQVIEMARIADGMIVEHWAEMDMLGLLKQLDLMPEPMGTRG